MHRASENDIEPSWWEITLFKRKVTYTIFPNTGMSKIGAKYARLGECVMHENLWYREIGFVLQIAPKAWIIRKYTVFTIRRMVPTTPAIIEMIGIEREHRV